MFYVFYVVTFCILYLMGHMIEDNGNKSDTPAYIIIVYAAIFVIMLTGLYCGHVFFMSIKQKTTNEALKKSEKYGYIMKQY